MPRPAGCPHARSKPLPGKRSTTRSAKDESASDQGGEREQDHSCQFATMPARHRDGAPDRHGEQQSRPHFVKNDAGETVGQQVRHVAKNAAEQDRGNHQLQRQAQAPYQRAECRTALHHRPLPSKGTADGAARLLFEGADIASLRHLCLLDRELPHAFIIDAPQACTLRCRFTHQVDIGAA